jgi:hypothetical protein
MVVRGRVAIIALARLCALAALIGLPAATIAQQAHPLAPLNPASGLPAKDRQEQTPTPRCDAACVKANAETASQACAPRVEAQAPADFDWLNRPFPGIFQQAQPSSPSDSVVTYRGDSIRFLTAREGWVRIVYECAYDVSTRNVAAIRVRPGRLDRPPEGWSPRPGPSRDVPDVTLAKRGIDKAMVAAAAAIPASTGRKRAPTKPRVGEPSLVEIEQMDVNRPR